MKRLFVIAMCSLALISCSASDQNASVVVCPPADVADTTAITPERAEMLVGLVEADAERCAADLGWAYRVGSRDGENFVLTADYSQQRVTVTITLGVVTAISVG